MRFNLRSHRRAFSFASLGVAVLCAYGVSVGDARADMLPGARCNPGFDSQTNLTWYGNSWGDFVDLPVYGWADWESYFRFHHPDVDWRIQNLAVG